MSPYIVVWMAMCLIWVKDTALHTSKNIRRAEFEICFIVLALMLTFRFGQGTDYFNYLYLYMQLPEHEIDTSLYAMMHGEFGWLLFANIFRVVGAPYEFYVAVVSVLQMIALHRFARIYDIQTVLTLIWLYPTVYLTYCFSGIRTGIVILVFLGFMLPMLEQHKHICYELVAILMLSLHGSAAILLVLPVVNLMPVRLLQIMTVISWGGGILIGTPIGQALIYALGNESLNYYIDGNISPSWFAICERLVFLIMITASCKYLHRTGIEDSVQLDVWYRCYLVSVSIYGLFCWSGFIASRFGVIVRYVEVLILIAMFANLHNIWKRLAVVIIVLYTGVMLIKNIHSYLSQRGGYTTEITVWNYPYVSIWNEDRIYEVTHLDRDIGERMRTCTPEEAGGLLRQLIKDAD